jgi:histidinol phosphatase-like enzyme (inositol monophosphatase family)
LSSGAGPGPSADGATALLAFALELADAARPIARRHFRAGPGVEVKADRTPVTAADREIEAELRARIRRRYPGHGILGEEEGGERVDAEYLWLLDPIDGTKAFATQNPMFGTLIGLMHRGVPIVGVMDAPALGERWAGAVGLGATHQGRPIRARPCRAVEDAVLYCTTPDPMPDHAGWLTLRRRVRWTSYGGDCIAYGLLAMGGAELVVDRNLKPHDWCALVPILTEAGAVLLDWQARPLSLQSDGAVLAASSRALAAAAIAVLDGA